MSLAAAGSLMILDLISGKHDVALFLEESVLHEEEEDYEDKKKKSIKKDLDELADEDVSIIYET